MNKGYKKISSRWGDFAVIATEPYSAGTTVMTFEGAVVSGDELQDYCHALQIGHNLYLGPSGKEDDYINHSCLPNCAVKEEAGRFYLVTISPIAEGEEFTFDYSTTMLNDPTSFLCRCGVESCRGLITSFTDLPDDLKEKFIKEGMVPRFVYKNGSH